LKIVGFHYQGEYRVLGYWVPPDFLMLVIVVVLYLLPWRYARDWDRSM